MEDKTRRFGYARVSSADQNENRQLDALLPFDIPAANLFIDKWSGKDFNRPAYKRLLRKVRRGDLLYVKAIDRLGRNYTEVIEQWRYLTREKGVDIKVLDMPLLDTTYYKDLLGTFIADLVLSVLSFASQHERDNIRQRQAEGIASAKARGVRFGQSPLPMPDNFDELFCAWRAGELSTAETARLCGFSKRTLYARTENLRRG